MHNYAILVIGIFCCSTSVIFIKQSDIHPILLASYRTLLASAILLPLAYNTLKSKELSIYIKASIIPGFLLATHFISWIYGARKTLATNSSLIVNMTPLVSPIFLYFLVKEKINKNELIGTCIAFSGVIILGFSDFHLDQKYFLGDAMCLGSMLLFSCYLIYARRLKHLPSLITYVSLVYFVCGAFCLLIAIVLRIPLFDHLDNNNRLQIIGLAIIPTILGHNLLNSAMKHIRGQVVSIMNQGQFIPAGVMAYFFLKEVPSFSFYIALCFLIIGTYIATKKTSSIT